MSTRSVPYTLRIAEGAFFLALITVTFVRQRLSQDWRMLLVAVIIGALLGAVIGSVVRFLWGRNAVDRLRKTFRASLRPTPVAIGGLHFIAGFSLIAGIVALSIGALLPDREPLWIGVAAFPLVLGIELVAIGLKKQELWYAELGLVAGGIGTLIGFCFLPLGSP